MQAAAESFPRKTREIQNVILDSTRWNGFKFRGDDIVIDIYGKSGAAWTRRLLANSFPRSRGRFVRERVFSAGGRSIRSSRTGHGGARSTAEPPFPENASPAGRAGFAPQVKYIYIGRDGRDTAWSMWNHHAGFTNRRMR